MPTGLWASSSIAYSQLPVALRLETPSPPHSIRAMSGAPLSCSGLKEAL